MSEPDKTSDVLIIDEIAEALAMSVSSITLDNEKIVRGGDHTPTTDGSPSNVLIKQYCKSIDSIKNNEKLNVLSKELAGNGLSPFLLQEILIGIVTTGFSADLPNELHQLPEVREILAKNLPVVDRALLGLATLLETKNDEPENTIRKQIVKNKETIQYFQNRLSELAAEQDIHAERIRKFESILNQVLWRATKMSSSALSGRCVQIVDKVGGRFGITPQKRREICVRLSAITSYDDGNSVMCEMIDKCASEHLLYDDLLNPNTRIPTGNFYYESSKEPVLKSIGAVLLGIGGRRILKNVRSPGGLFLITGGVVALFLGLIVVIGLWLFS
ncbi:MAG: hypothetical protein ACM31E_06250 [Fibrobacterota bacterium]